MGRLKFKRYLFFSEEQDKLKNIKEFLKKRHDITITSSAAWNIEITDRQVNKGTMLEQVAEYYGYSKEEVLVFGDGKNDILMFEKFPHSSHGKCSRKLEKKSQRKLSNLIEMMRLHKRYADCCNIQVLELFCKRLVDIRRKNDKRTESSD